MKRKFKLIKPYPGFEKVGIEVIQDIPNGTKFNIIDNDEIIGHFFNDSISKFPEFWKEITQKEYEILSFSGNGIFDKKKKSSLFNSAEEAFYSNRGTVIHSIKRLSDGQIFTIGDYLDKKCICHESNSVMKITKIGIIDKPNYQVCSSIAAFSLNKLMLSAGNVLGNYNVFLKDAIIKDVLLTTEDGVDIIVGDKLFQVWNDKSQGHKNFHWSVHSFTTADNVNYAHNQEFNKENYGLMLFSSEKAANEYVLMNKPCLSINDFHDIDGITISAGELFDLKEKVKSCK